MTAENTFEIRQLGSDDIGLMREMLACFGDAFSDRDTYTAAQPTEDYLRELLADGSFVSLVAIADSRVVGGLVAYELRKFERERSEFYIYDLAVSETYRRRGIATALIGALKPIAKSRGAWVIFVQADIADDPAISLYGRLGRREDVLHFDIPID